MDNSKWPTSVHNPRKMNQDQIAYIIKDVLHALIYLQVIFNYFTITPFNYIKVLSLTMRMLMIVILIMMMMVVVVMVVMVLMMRMMVVMMNLNIIIIIMYYHMIITDNAGEPSVAPRCERKQYFAHTQC